ncbi:DNA repair protein RadA [candidate division WOR-3 bacterium JGI_Cruoil_03_51_56]|uniref:DNA repair protein RadA n=1 Tax=candidate division WOR-3 bacterium JGI_Cruoil_03_51_56 TaxID=1973747 RepID=A0A235BXV4_UNCW3|nr:MAG: DNA repair protein RadA [candidate division WOR-3 bacterium JGI_Cruoil_03_51_56]
MKNTAFVCQNCGFETSRWVGRCPNCGQWNTMVEEKRIVKKTPRNRRVRTGPTPRPLKLTEIKTQQHQRQSTGIGELDRVLGGGLVPGSLLLIGGEPGIGKSTLTLQVCDRLAHADTKVLYISGEESVEQIRLRAERLRAENEGINLFCAVELDEIVEATNQTEPGLLVIDSIQSVFSSNLTSAPGSVSQVRECTAELLRMAKARTITTILIGHITKYGAIAGPKTLEHMVDTVLYFEGERFQQYRILRAVKNRFGSTNEIGVFEMGDAGLTEVNNPSRFFLSGRRPEVSGSAVTATVEGTRPLLVEIQALAARTPYAIPQHVATGFDGRRLSMLLCVLEHRAGVATAGKDVFLNIAGGLKIQEPAADLGVLAALASSVRNIPISPDTVFVGEVGLGGEVRSVARAEARINEAARLGFSKIILPRRNMTSKMKSSPGVKLLAVESVRQTLEKLGGT